MIEALIKSHNLSDKDAEKVRIIWRVGNEVADLNVNDLLKTREAHCKIKLGVNGYYEFRIESNEALKKRFRTKRTPYGYCSLRERKIVLNIDHVLLSPIEEIADTILHECAHAVDYHYYGTSGHGKNWKKVSRMFGNTALATSKEGSDDLKDKRLSESKYALVYLDDKNYKVELIGGFNRKLKNLKNRLMKNNRATLGKLYMVRTEHYAKFGPDFDEIINVAFR